MTDDQQRARELLDIAVTERGVRLAAGSEFYAAALAAITAALRAAPEGWQEPVCFIPTRDAELLRNREFSLVSMHSRWERPSGESDWVGVYLAARPQGVKDV